MSAEADRYALRGVSASKEDVHAAIAGLDKGLFPRAFCKIVADDLTGSEGKTCRTRLLPHACAASVWSG